MIESCEFGFGLVTLPYALVLFLVQWLQKHSHYCVCSWVVKMKPLFDAYTGPYKAQCRFWTGALLLVRVVIFVAFAFSSTQPDMKLSLILTTCITLQMIAWSFRGVFLSTYTEILNSLFLLNLGLFTVATIYNSHTGQHHQAIVIYVSVGITWIVFNLVLIYNTFLQIRATKKWKHLELWFNQTSFFRFRKTNTSATFTDDTDAENERPKPTYSIIDPIEYREPLICSDSSSYGAL